MKLNCSINFYQDFTNICPDQDQTGQTVQSDVGFTLSVNFWDIFFVKYIIFKWQYLGFKHMLESFIQLFFQQVKD